MKKVVLLAIIFMFSGAVFSQETSNTNFKMKIKWVKNQVVFECANGCGYQMAFNAKRTVVLDQFGMVNVQKNLVKEDTSDYQFSYTKKGNQIILKGIKGVAWGELKLDFKKEYTFDNNGLVGS
ncbi:hypothetical protein [Flavobacterium sp.]|uniref:hypothetical protein n=1 Tax=Flavobacterium sp. TaxID=239 RepID=UPI00261E4DA6|nr:hypothetical protein [Flavobacterium sp.]